MKPRSPFAEDPATTQFLVAPSCPPDTRVHVRGGLLWRPWDGAAWRIPAGSVDLADPVNLYGSTGSPLYGSGDNYQIAFDNAGYYRVYCLLVQAPYVAADGPAFRLSDLATEAEFETAAEAEAAWAGTVTWEQEAWYQGYPVCGLIVRGDGRVGTPGAILAIDRVNRGRSYIWPPDCRPLDYLA